MMTSQEFDKIRAALKSAWPSANIMPDKFSINLWYQMLKDIPYKVCSAAVMELMGTEKYAPSIAQIREKCSAYKEESDMEAGEAWEFVRKMIRKYGHPGELEALAEMDDLTREATQAIGFLNICKSENIMVERAHFLKIYDSLRKRRKNDRMLPPAVLANKHRIMEIMQNPQEHIGIPDAEGGTPDGV